MHAMASPQETEFRGDASFGAFLAALAPFSGRELAIVYGGRAIRPGYHVTEVKAGAFVTLDCGGNPDAWRETILQVEDLGPEGTPGYLLVDRLRGILDRVARQVALDRDSRLTFEVGPPDEAMRVFDADTLRIEDGRAVLRLAPRPATCKPRHRASQACCAPKADREACCAVSA